MKIRAGFVSNSSSSSFCIIGINSASLMNELAIADNVLEDGEFHPSQGVTEGHVLNFYGSCGTIYYTGIDAEPLLEKMTIPAAREHFQKIIKKSFALEIPLDQISLHYGEIGDG